MSEVFRALTRRPFRTAFVSLVWVLACQAGAHACESEWQNFVKEPTEMTHNALKSVLDECKIKGTSPRVMRLLRVLVEARNPFATDIALSSVVFLDSGDLEDTVKALARLADTDPNFLLRGALQKRLSDQMIGRLFVSLPDTVVDDNRARSLWIRERIGRLLAVDDADLQRPKGIALQQLRRSLARIDIETERRAR